MTRPLFETTLDMGIERKVAHAYAKHYHLKPHKQPAQALYDYDMVSAISDRVIIRIEIKGRKPQYRNLIEQNGYMLSAKKFKALQLLHGEIPVALVVVFMGSPDMYSFSFSPHKVQDVSFAIGGRTKKKRDDRDVEEVAYIPWKHFVKLEGKND